MFNVFIFQKEDWRCDGYRWKNVGVASLPRKDPVIKKLYFHIITKDKPKGSSDFTRTVYQLPENPHLTLVHYLGDSSSFHPLPHGNKKNPSAGFVRTCPSVLKEMEENLKQRGSANVYRDMQSKNKEGFQQGICNPRNLRQVQNVKRTVDESKRLSKDGIYNIIELAYHIPDFVLQIDIFPDLVAVLGVKNIFTEFKKLLRLKSDSPLRLGYDTTFECGDFYVSPLIFAHVLFENDPTIPLAFLIHDRKLETSHQRFFEIILQKLPQLAGVGIPIITDRERAIKNVIGKVLPALKNLSCWNHLRQDLRFFLRQCGARPDEISVYGEPFLTILDTEHEDNYEEVCRDQTLKWSEEVVDYFNRELKEDIRSDAARFVIERFDLYDPYSGVTNNPSEGLNFVMKQLLEWKEVPVDVMFLIIHKLQKYYEVEILRGRAGVGNLKLKSRHKNASLNRDDLLIPDIECDPKEIVKNIKEGKTLDQLDDQRKMSSSTEVPEINRDRDRMSQRAMAADLVSKGKVVHVPNMGSFMVEGTGGLKYAVSLFPKESCQCPSTTRCYHILAAQMSVGLEKKDSKICNLSILRKKSRKRTDYKSGRKKPRPKDVDVIGAPDSQEANEDLGLVFGKEKKTDLTETVKQVKDVNFIENQDNNSNLEGVGRDMAEARMAGDRSSLVSSPIWDFVEAPSLRDLQATSHKERKEHTVFDPIEEPVEAIISAVESKGFDDVFENELLVETVETLVIVDENCVIENSITYDETWVARLKLEVSHLNSIKNQEWLNDVHMNAVQELLKNDLPHVNGLQNTLLVPQYDKKKKMWHVCHSPMLRVSSPSVQIHYTGYSHWVVSFRIDDNSPVYLLDSLYSPASGIPTFLQIQLAQIYDSKDGNLIVRIQTSNQQKESRDCGLFAIANCVEFCMDKMGDIEDHDWKYDQKKMRDHLIGCLETEIMTCFPKLELKSKKKRISMTEVVIDIDCTCGLPNTIYDMIGCEGIDCGKWYHKSCAGIMTDGDPDFWLCSNCNK